MSVSTASGSCPQSFPPKPRVGPPQVNLPTLGPPSPVYKLDIRPGPNSQLRRGDSQNQKQIKQPESLGEGRGGGQGRGKSIKSCWGHGPLSPAPHPARGLT